MKKMGKELTLTSPIKVASSPSAVTADKLAEGQVAIYDDGTGALGIAGKALGRLLRSPTGGTGQQDGGKVPLTLVTGPGYFAAPTGTIDPATDRMVFYTMGSVSRNRNLTTGKKHKRKKRFTRMGKTGAKGEQRQTSEAVEATISYCANTIGNPMEFFNADLTELEAELRRKFYSSPNGSTITIDNGKAYFRLGGKRYEVGIPTVETASNSEIVRFSIGVAIMRGETLLTDILVVNVSAYSTTGSSYAKQSNDAAKLLFFIAFWNSFASGKFWYSPVRRHTTIWEQPQIP